MADIIRHRKIGSLAEIKEKVIKKWMIIKMSNAMQSHFYVDDSHSSSHVYIYTIQHPLFWI